MGPFDVERAFQATLESDGNVGKLFDYCGIETAEAGPGGRHDSPDIIRWRYRQQEKVETYEQRRYGNIRRSLSHFMDCDAIDQFIRQAYPQRPVRALDLACGTGRLTRTLARPGLTIVSSDYSDAFLRLHSKEYTPELQPRSRTVFPVNIRKL